MAKNDSESVHTLAYAFIVQNQLPLITAVHLGCLSNTTHSPNRSTAPINRSVRPRIVSFQNCSDACVRFAYIRTVFFSKRKRKGTEQNGIENGVINRMERNEMKRTVNIISHTVFPCIMYTSTKYFVCLLHVHRRYVLMYICICA